MSGESPEINDITAFDNDHVWRSDYESTISSAEITYLRSLNQSLSYQLVGGVASNFYRLSTSEYFRDSRPSTTRDYISRYINYGALVHYHLKGLFKNFHFSSGIIAYSLVQSKIRTRSTLDAGHDASESYDQMNGFVPTTKVGINYSLGNETILFSLNASTLVKWSAFNKLLEASTEKLIGSITISGYLNLNKFKSDKYADAWYKPNRNLR